MDLENLKNEYKFFLEQASLAHSCLYEFLPKINSALIKYCKMKNFDEKFANELDINLLYLEKILEDFDNIMELFEKITFLEMNYPKKEEKIGTFFTKKYEKDIFVDCNYKIDWKNL